MKHVLKTCCVLLLAIAMFFSLVACNGGGDREVKVIDNPDTYVPDVSGTVMFTYNAASAKDEDAPDAFIAAFETKYKEATVKKDYSPGNIPARISSGEIGDVFHFTEAEVYNYAITQEALLDLSPYINVFDIDLSEVYAGVYKVGTIGGKLYMVSRDYNHISMIYNKDALTTAGLTSPQSGWTWDEFKSYASQLTVKDSTDSTKYSQVGAYWDLDWDPVYVSILEGWGGKWVDTETKKVNLTSEEVIQGITEVLSFANTGAMYPIGKSDKSAYSELEDTDYVFRTLVYPQLTSYAGTFDQANIEWDLCDFPAFPTHAVGTGSSGFGVYKYTEDPDTAAALALFFFTDEGQEAYHTQYGGSVPLTRSLSDQDFWRFPENADWKDKNYDAFVSYPDADIVGRPICRMPSQVSAQITSSWSGVLTSYFSVQNVIDALTVIESKANQTWDRILQSYN